MSEFGWQLGLLREIAQSVGDKWVPTSTETDVPYVGLEHISPENPKIGEYGNSSEVISTKNLFKKGDTLFGKLRPYLKKVALADLSGVCSTDIIPIRANQKADPIFIYYLLSSPKIIAKAVESSAGNVMPRASWSDLADIEIEIPPLPEQKKIAEILSGIDTRITADSKKLEKLFYLLQAVIEAEVQLGSRKTPSLPLSSLFAEKPSNGISPPETEDEESIAAPGIDCISKSGFEAKRLKKVRRPNDWQRYLIKEGDFFITRANTPALVGMCAVATGIQQEMIYPDLMIRLRFKKPIHATYLESVFKSSFYRQIIQNSAQGTSQSMAKLNSQIISNIKVAIPEDSEVTQFNNNIKRILESIRFQKSKIDRLQKLKSGLSQDLLSGRKRVSV